VLYILKRNSILETSALFFLFVISSIVSSIFIDSLPLADFYISFVWLFGLVYSFSGRGLNILQFVLISFFIFGLSIPFFSLIGLYDYPVGNLIAERNHIYIPIPESVLVESYLYISFFIWGCIIGFSTVKNIQITRDISSSNNAHLSLIFYLVFAIVTSEKLLMFLDLEQFGYIKLVHHTISFGASGALILILNAVFVILFLLLVIRSKDLKLFKRYAIIFLLPFVLLALVGQRGMLFLNTIVVLFLYGQLFEIKRAFYILLLLLAVLAFFSFHVIEIARFHGYENLSIVELLLDTIHNLIDKITFTASNLSLVSYVILFEGDFVNKVPFVFGYLDAIFSLSPNYSIEGILNKSYLAQHMTYLIDENRLFGGSTVGTNFVAELYEVFGGFYAGYFVVGVFLFWIFGYLLKRSGQSSFYVYLFYLFLSNLIYLSRGSIFKMFNKVTVTVLILILCLILVRFFLIKLRKKSENCP